MPIQCLIFVSALLLAAPLCAQERWRLVWHDEFDGPAGTLPDPSKWTYDLGNNNGWGNRELEVYTNSTENVFLDGNGNLVIRALQPAPDQYTSARLKTQGLFAVRYGKIEARIKIPYGQGIWPAFWMLGANIRTVGWPACGEIDIMENIGREPAIVHGTIHGPGYSGGQGITAAYTLPTAGAAFPADFHTFAVLWNPESIQFLVDGAAYQKVAAPAIPNGTAWVFNAPFFLLLNMAVGGNWPAYPDATSTFPQTMLVDYVRVYRDEHRPR